MKKQHEPLPEDMPALTERLRALHDRPIEVPSELDEGILAAAREQLHVAISPSRARSRLSDILRRVLKIPPTDGKP